MPAAPIRLVAALAATALLGACAAGGPPPRSAGVAPVAGSALPAAPLRLAIPGGGAHAAQVLMAPGLEGVIGATAPQLVTTFGTPRLDVAEGDARKLQFTNGACVLDVFLYPDTRQPGEPRATYVAARRADDGRDTDRAACVAALRRAG